MSAYEALPPDRRDVHAHPMHLLAYTAAYGWPAYLAEYRGIVQPFLLAPGRRLRHAFNYGGPLHSPETTVEDWAHYAVELSIWKHDIGAVHEYCSYNPALSWQQRRSDAYRVKDVVLVDLVKVDYRSTTRHTVEKAKSNGVIVHRVKPAAALNDFCALYSATMERRAAAEHWRFPREYFAQLLASLPRQTMLLFAYVGCELEAGALVIHDCGRAYYHLAGSYMRHPNSGAPALLVDYALTSARDAGCDVMCLGGGATTAPNDGLLTFKSGFSKWREPYYVYEAALADVAA